MIYDLNRFVSKEGFLWIVSNRVRTVARHYGLGARELSELAGVSYNTVLNFYGCRNMPNVYTMNNIAYALDCSFLTFVGEDDYFVSDNRVPNVDWVGYPDDDVFEWALEKDVNALNRFDYYYQDDYESKSDFHWRVCDKIGKVFDDSYGTYREVAAHVDVQPTIYWRYLTFEQTPTFAAVVNVATAMGITPDAILGKPRNFVQNDIRIPLRIKHAHTRGEL